MNDKTTTDERRAHHRHDTSLEIQGGVPEGAVAQMVTHNLSLGGLYCRSTTDFPEMTQLALTLCLPENGEAKRLEAEAVVVRRTELQSSSGNGDRRFELGLFFTKMEQADKDVLARFLESRQN